MTSDRGSLPTRYAVVFVALAAALLAVTATGALPVTDGPPDGDAVLERVEDRYANASTVLGNVTVTVGNETANASVDASFVLGEGNRSRLTVYDDGHRYVVATNGSVAWAHNASSGALLVVDLPENRSAVPANRSALLDRVSASVDGVSLANGTVASARNASWTNGTWGGANHSWTAIDASNRSWADTANWTRAWNGTATAWNGSADRNWTALGESVAANVTAETVGTEAVDGAESYVVRLTHDDERVDGTVTLWVDTEDYSVHRVRASDGANRTVFDFDDQRFNVSVYDTEFQPPGDAAAIGRFSRASYDSFDAVQANTPLSLRALDGATFDRAVVTTQAGRTVAVQSYTDGNRSVAVVATAESLPVALDNGTEVTVAGHDATYVAFGDRAAVVWETDGVTRAVVGDLSRGALVDVAERVVE